MMTLKIAPTMIFSLMLTSGCQDIQSSMGMAASEATFSDKGDESAAELHSGMPTHPSNAALETCERQVVFQLQLPACADDRPDGTNDSMPDPASAMTGSYSGQGIDAFSTASHDIGTPSASYGTYGIEGVTSGFALGTGIVTRVVNFMKTICGFSAAERITRGARARRLVSEHVEVMDFPIGNFHDFIVGRKAWTMATRADFNKRVDRRIYDLGEQRARYAANPALEEHVEALDITIDILKQLKDDANANIIFDGCRKH